MFHIHFQAGNVFILTFPELEEFSQYDVTEEQVRELEAAQTRLAEDNVSLAGSVDVNLDSTNCVHVSCACATLLFRITRMLLSRRLVCLLSASVSCVSGIFQALI